MNNFLIGTALLIFVGGGFQAKAFFHAKKEMDALDKKFKALLK